MTVLAFRAAAPAERPAITMIIIIAIQCDVEYDV